MATPDHPLPLLRAAHRLTLVTLLLMVSWLAGYAIFQQTLPLSPDDVHTIPYQFNSKDRTHYVTPGQRWWLALGDAGVLCMTIATVAFGAVATYLSKRPRSRGAENDTRPSA